MTATRSSMGWSLAEKYLGLVISLAASMVLARLLTPAEIGIFSLCAAVMAVASTVRDFGVSDYIIQERELDEQRLRQAFGVAIATAWPVGIAIFLSRDLLANYYNEPRLAPIIAVLCLSFTFLPLSSPAYAVLNREMEFRKILAVQSLATVVGSISTIVLAAKGYGPFSLAWGAVIAILTQVLAVTVVRPSSSMILPSFKGSGRILKFGLFQVSSRVLESATSNLHEFVIARYFGFAAAGLFSRAKGLADIFHTSFTAAIARVATPDMAAALRDKQSLTSTFARGTAIFTSLSWFFFGFVAMAAPEIIRLMFGPQWDRAGPIASVMALSMLPSALFALSGSVMAAMGQVQRRLVITFQWCPVHMVGLFVAASFGLEMMAVAWGVTNVVIAFAFARQLCHLMQATLRQLFAPSLRSVPICAAAALVQFAILHVGREAGLHALPLLLGAGVAGFLTWFFVAGLLKHPAHTEVSRIVLWAASKRR